MKAIIISAGSATRLGKHAKNIPKGLLDINGKSIIERQISLFQNNGIHEIILIVGPYKEKFNFPHVRYIEDKNFEEHDVLGSLMAARNEFNDELIISYSDILFDENILENILNFDGNIGIGVDLNWEKNYENRTSHPKSEADNVLILENKVIQIKKNILEKNSDQILGEFIGMMKLSNKGSKLFLNEYLKLEQKPPQIFHNAASFKKAYLTDLLQELIDSEIDISPIFVDGKWQEIDTPQDLDVAKNKFR